MKKVFCCMFALFALLTGVAVGQYHTTYSAGTVDITSMTGTVNAWKALVGNQVCASKTLTTASNDVSIWCIGNADRYPYTFNPLSHAWTRHGPGADDMGTSIVRLIVKDINNVYSLQSVAHCGVHGGIQFYGFFRWIGSWQEQNSTACASQGTIGNDDVADTIGWDLVNNQPAIFQSTDEGSSWTLINDGYSFVNMPGTGSAGCVIDTTYGVWTGTIGNPLNAWGILPSGNAVGCVQGHDPGLLMAWNSSGSVYVMPTGTTNWQKVTGISMETAVAMARSGYYILGEDNSGIPYHWNINIGSISGTTTGSWNNCPGPGNICQPSATHTGKLLVHYKSGHGINAGAGIQLQTIPSTGAMNITSWDANPGCDPLFGVPTDVECQVESSGGEQCNQANTSVPDNPPTLSKGMAIDAVGFAGAKNFIGPTQSGTEQAGAWSGQTTINVFERCNGISVSTCPVGNTVTTKMNCIYTGYGANIACYADVKQRMLDRLDGVGQPWIIMTPYLTEDGNNTCFYNASGPLIPYGPDGWAMPDCQ